MNEIPLDDRCEACFGKGTITTVKPARFGHPIDITPPPTCAACKGTGRETPNLASWPMSSGPDFLHWSAGRP